MLSFHTLDAIADAFNPALLILSLLLPALPNIRRSIHVRYWYAMVGLSLAVVYGAAGLDKQLNLWSSAQADFSTHSAFAIALALVARHAGTKVFVVVSTLVFAYLVLVVYQGYHSAVDVISTCLFVGGIVALAQHFMTSRGAPVRRSAVSPEVTSEHGRALDQ